MATVSLFTLTCLETSESAGDEVFINVDDQRVFGIVEMNNGQAREVGFSKPFSGQVRVNLYDTDNGSDPLGSIVVRENEAGQGRKVGTFREARAHYTLTYEVVG